MPADCPSPVPSAFLWEAGSVGVLLIHGLTSSASAMRPLGTYLHRRGLTISAPLLPGHGTHFSDLRRIRSSDWSAHVSAAWHDLKSRCDSAFVVGQSLGSLLSIQLAAQRTDVEGIVLLSSPFSLANHPGRHLLPILKHVIPSLSKSAPYWHNPRAAKLHWDYNRTPLSTSHEAMKLMLEAVRLLPSVKCPVLMIHSKDDRVASPEGARRAYERIGSPDKHFLLTERSGHCLTLDSDRGIIARAIHDFVAGHSRLP